MPSKPSIPPPAIGTLIDNDTLELVEVIGYGGYGVVYRAIPTSARSFSTTPVSYAVKCLVHSQSSRQRQLHIREITLHRLASAHRGVVTLHRVIEDADYTYIVMDYCPDGDLFSQILHHRRYLGYDALIKHVFLQLLDAVDHCHSLGIYHRDLKPENILCYDDGLRVGITDFGLATTDKVSQEFRTGSVYHMSPECQGGRFAPTGQYSPLFNDVWSLGIILLNLATGRNPWKSASLSDPTFHAYLSHPETFLPTVLPISQEVNAILVKVLEVDWRKRITLKELRREIRAINNFYSHDAVFEGSMARCSWEVGADVDSDSEDSEVQPPELPQQPAQEPAQAQNKKAEPKLKLDIRAAQEAVVQADHEREQLPTPALPSAWTKKTDSEMVFAANSVAASVSSWGATINAQATDAAEPTTDIAESWVDYSSDATSWAIPTDVEAAVRSLAPSPSSGRQTQQVDPVWPPVAEIAQVSPSVSFMVEHQRPSAIPWSRSLYSTPSTSSSSASDSASAASLPATPRAGDNFSDGSSVNSLLTPPASSGRGPLTLDTSSCTVAFYGDDEGISMGSPDSSMMQTAVESLVHSPWASAVGPWADPFYAISPVSAGKTPIEMQPRSALDVIMTDSDEDADGEDEDDAKPVVDALRSPVSCGTIATLPSRLSSARQSAISVELEADRSASGSEAGSAPASPMVVSPRFDRGGRPGHLLSLLSTANPAGSTPAAAGDPSKSALSPRSGKTRPQSKRRGSSRFNPLRQALRSISPGRLRSRSSSSGVGSGVEKEKAVAKEKEKERDPATEAWAELALMNVRAPSPPGADLVRKVFPQMGNNGARTAQQERRLRSSRKRHWFGTGRLFATGCA